MSKFKVEFTLKQHTPIIHFQSDQSGATLRASELKPKFDRFLKKYAFNGEIPKEFKIKDDTDAIDFKVKIYKTKVCPVEIKNKSYFANMGKNSSDDNFRKATISNNTFTIEFISFKPNILKEVRKYFCTFMAYENFGSRQSKGFGSFYIDKNDEKYIEPKEALNIIDSNYIFASYNEKNSEKIFEHVEVIYPLIKTGINFPNHPKKEKKTIDGKRRKVLNQDIRGSKASYYKSYLFQYMLKKGIGNEKKFIKENFFRNVRDDYSSNDKQAKKYVRALLGISDGVEFKDKRRGEIIYSNEEIKRFKSPLTFKIIDNEMIIIAKDINPNLYGKTFKFSNTFRSRNENQTINKYIEVPNQNEFDLNDFLYSFANYFNNLNCTNKNMFDQKIQAAKKATFSKANS